MTMLDRVRQDTWKAGISNRSDWRKTPEDALRDAVNVNVSRDGSLSLRSGFERVYAGASVRGALAIGSHVLIADGNQLVAMDTATDTAVTIATIAGGGRLSGCTHNDELFFCTENEVLRYHAGKLRRWGVPTVTAQPLPSLISGGLLPGTYQLAMTWLSDNGEEGGTTSAVQIAVAERQGLQVDLPSMAGHTPLLYVSAPNGSTLYLQGKGAGTHALTALRDDTARLETQHLREPIPFDHIDSSNGVIALASGKCVWITCPMMPHLLDMAKRFFQYPCKVGFVMAGRAGLIISADKTYLISGAEGEEPVQSDLLPYPGVPGTAVELPDGRIAWMTQYGLAVESPGGGAELVGNQNFVPQPADRGTSSVLEHDGDQLVVTTMQPGRGANPLAATDYYEAEILSP